jgi:hypothetical protein
VVEEDAGIELGAGVLGVGLDSSDGDVGVRSNRRPWRRCSRRLRLLSSKRRRPGLGGRERGVVAGADEIELNGMRRRRRGAETTTAGDGDLRSAAPGPSGW